jgi:hypothetical protein
LILATFSLKATKLLIKSRKGISFEADSGAKGALIIAYKILVVNPEGNRSPWRHLGRDGRIIVKLILNK